MAKTLLALRDIVVEYGESVALQIPLISVCAGEVVSLLGPNGAGKSTLIRIMALLQSPTAGTVSFDDEESIGKNGLRIRRRIATVFQNPLLLKGTVFDNVALGLRMRGLGKDEIEKRVTPWLSRLNIKHLAFQPVHTLSGGEAQRTSLARAFVLKPDLLLLDEPFSPLDPIGRDDLLTDLHQILKETGTTTVLVTHHRDEAFMLADRVGVLNDGRLLQLGPTRDVFLRPLTEKVAEIVGVENRIPGVVKESSGTMTTVEFDSQTMQVDGRYDAGSRVILCIRAEELCLNQSDNCMTEDKQNRFNGRIVSVSSRIPYEYVTLRIGSRFVFVLVPRNKSHQFPLREGEDVVVTFSRQSVHVIPARET